MILAPGEERWVEWRLGGGALLQGIVLGSEGRALADYELWLLGTRRERPVLSRQFEGPLQRTRTDAQGRFALADVPRGEWWLGPPIDPWDQLEDDGLGQLDPEDAHLARALRALYLDQCDGITDAVLAHLASRSLVTDQGVAHPRRSS